MHQKKSKRLNQLKLKVEHVAITNKDNGKAIESHDNLNHKKQSKLKQSNNEKVTKSFYKK
jgi:hypothetical protein